MIRRALASCALASCALAAFALAGCAVGPDFHTPAAPKADHYAANPAGALAASDQPQALHPGAETPAEWWRAFRSPQLDALVAEALKANPDLKSADAALRQARELLAAQRGAFLPSVGASYQAQRARSSQYLSPVPADNSTLYTLHTAEVDVSYGLDVFGANRRAAEAAKAGAEGQRFQYEAARTALIANVVAAAVQEAALRRQVKQTEIGVAAGRDVLAMTRRQAELGALGEADVTAQETSLSQAEQSLPPLQKALAQQQSALAVLLGREPAEDAAPSLSLEDLCLPSDLPVALPAQLVRQRPDVRAAEETLHVASAQVGVAVAARLPNLTLTASYGGAGDALQRLFTQSNDFWSLSAGVTQPIFQGGALRRRQKAAEAALDQAKDQYRSTALNALKDVSDTLDALGHDAEAQAVAERGAVAAERSLQFSRRQMELGQIGALTERGAEQAAAQARSAIAAARAARFADTAALFQALGGGWSDAAPDAGAAKR